MTTLFGSQRSQSLAPEGDDTAGQRHRDDEDGLLWIVGGESVLGASHERSKTPNQDHVGWIAEAGAVILVVSDGHGSSRYFRSDVGARLAVEAGLTTLKSYLVGNDLAADQRRKWISEKLSRDLVKKWREVVMQHVEENGFSEESRQEVKRRDGQSILQAIEEDPTIVYGATFLGVAITQDFMLQVQLGDGDILTVDEDGAVEERIRPSELLIANETPSLCQKEAWKSMRLDFQILRSKVPALVLVSTDGYSNSFVTTEDFRQVGVDLLKLFRVKGPDYVTQEVGGWLKKSSERGSGDDISLGWIYRARPGVPAATTVDAGDDVKPEEAREDESATEQ